MTSDTAPSVEIPTQSEISPNTHEQSIEVRAVALAKSHNLSDERGQAEADRRETERRTENRQPSPSGMEQRRRDRHAARREEGAAPRESRPRLLNRLKTQRILLHDAYLLFVRLTESEEIHSYAAEWLLDNYYVVQQVLRQIEEDMPEKYYRQLPKLGRRNPNSGLPRVYGIALELVRSSEARLDMEEIDRFVAAYQTITPLTMGEIWALPVMLRFSIIEVLAQASTRILDIGTLDEGAPGDMFGESAPQDTLVANCIISLRALAIYDWKGFFERSSLAERELEGDPAGVLGQMDFDTRDAYRKVVEKLARRSGVSEIEVSRKAVELARQARDENGQSPRRAHVGYYLIDRGRAELEDALGYQPEGLDAVRRWLRLHPLRAFTGAVGAITLLLLLVLLIFTRLSGASAAQTVGALLAGAIPAVTLAVGLVNWLVTAVLRPTILPKLDFATSGEGIPPDRRAMVVIPALLTSEQEARSLVQQLEIHYLRNNDPNLAFALLTDFPDAPEQTLPEDAALLKAAADGIQALHEHYPGVPFFLLHRERRWNPKEGVWMGWERKRGKLEELNRLLLGQNHTSYTTILGDLSAIHPVRYVITLDADTLLPQGAAARLVGAMAHPLCEAEFGEDGHTVAGYTVLQPRADIKPTSARQTVFTRLFNGDIGLDLYTRAVSDVYQDLFGEGIYVGKGIYDVPAFERSLRGQIPENTLLSHDLLEGLLGRAGLVTDIILFEEFPPNYLAFTRRMHRWIRGDWQVLPWLFSLGANAGPGKLKLNRLDRWKILDNLRRSLYAPAVLTLLLLGWLWLPGSPLFWTFIALVVTASPVLTGIANNIYRRKQETVTDPTEPRQTFNQADKEQLQRWLLSLVFLPYEATTALSAVLVTLWRMNISKRKMLEWTPSAAIARFFGETSNPTLGHWEAMILSPLLALFTGGLLFYLRPASLIVAAPLLLAWLAAPQVAAWLDRPAAARVMEALSEEDRRKLRRLARRTWFFFEQFVGPGDHWLPPDHFQETPRGTVAHRTSTTNIGLGMLSTLAAYDMGYTGLQDAIMRLRNTMDALSQLEMYRGHYLNWYDTSTLTSLPPRYVSTVDSGNLIGSLIALRWGLQELPDKPIQRWENWEGLLDTLGVFTETSLALEKSIAGEEGHLPPEHPTRRLTARAQDLRERILAEREPGVQTPERWGALLEEVMQQHWPAIEQDVLAVIDPGGADSGPGGADSSRGAADSSRGAADGGRGAEFDPQMLRSVRLWADRVRHGLIMLHREQRDLTPWVNMLAAPPRILTAAPPRERLGLAWQEVLDLFRQPVTLRGVQATAERGAALLRKLCDLALDASAPPAERQEAANWCGALGEALPRAQQRAALLLEELGSLDSELDATIKNMDFHFLYDRTRNVFHIGYNLDAQRMDSNYYDLLASEARIASLVAIGKGDVPLRHWLHLGRPLTRANGGYALLSWSGTMFEYLMPTLLLREYPDTLLNESAYNAVRVQIQYGQEKDVPWGISESGFYFFDAAQNYQYRAFGVPGLGFKRGLSEDLVVTPYASLLALPFAPREVLENMRRLDEMNILADYGYYEAIDFTQERLTLGQQYAVVRSFMAHHQGMILLQLANVLQDWRMVRRFHRSSRIRSADLLLQEQAPEDAPLERLAEVDEEAPANIPLTPQVIAAPWRVTAESGSPRVHYLSNGRYSVLVTSRGGGYSRWQDPAGKAVDLTRWRADTTLDDWGPWVYLQDLENDTYWTAGWQIPPPGGGQREVFFAPHRADFNTTAARLTLNLQITVSPEDDVEIRRVRVGNPSDQPRKIALVSYGEVVLTSMDADRRHPAFNKMVVESEWVPRINGLLFRRRPRAASDTPVYLLHAITASKELTSVTYESSRMRFLGRGRTSREPQALDPGGPGLTGATGYVLDPVFALRTELEVGPHEAVEVAFLTLAGGSRHKVVNTARRYEDWGHVERTYDHARFAAEIEMRRMELTTPDVERYQTLLSALLYPQPALRAPAEVLAANVKGQPGLWAYSVSGDYPIVLVKVGEKEEITLLRELLNAHAYWRSRGLQIDLVVLNDKESGYSQEVHDRIFQLLVRTGNDSWLNRRGGIFLLRQEVLSPEDKVLLQSVARAIFDSAAGAFADQLAALQRPTFELPPFQPVPGEPGGEEPLAPLEHPNDLLFDNGYGGFSPDGREYVIYLEPGQWTPMPWINVIANENAGFWVSEAGGGYTWAANSGENRLTPWSNDPVGDQPGEAIYLRDEETAEIWSPTPLPAGEGAPTLVRHGTGYSIFKRHSHGMVQELTLFVPPEAPLKVARLRLENRWQRVRRITVTYFAEWVLGVNRDQMAPYIIPEYDNEHNALLARNPYQVEFGERVAFLASSQEPHGLTASRGEFLGRWGSYRRPTALERVGLSGEVRAGLDPCAAIQIHVDLQPGEEREVFFLLGQGQDRDDALRLVAQFQQPGQVQAAFQQINEYWQETLEAVQVTTPDPGMDLVLNRWLLYQDLSCRVWGRSALYQSSGAYGFRDQLQDVMALVHTRPHIAREQILRAARHQFEQGDVLHWWHPPSGRGVRTRHSDDMLWLPYVTAEYIESTGDRAILWEKVPFKTAEELKPEEEDRYGDYPNTREEYSLYTHCLRALQRGSTRGPHGLPLILTGDWNDGMNRVGVEGRGESIWLGWFLYNAIHRFVDLCMREGESPPLTEGPVTSAADLLRQAEELKTALHAHGWDGRWYLRGYYDSGQPLGSAESLECQIDAIAQSWALLSGAGQPERDRQAMQSVRERLVQRDGALIRLFTPAFNKTPHDPGYIKAYPPGVRENGGQYTHAATWTVWAYTLLGEGDVAGELYRMVNPVYHGDTPEHVAQYRTEPYIVAADVYSEPPHIGHGGWTWYTGSAGWFYRLGLEAILGLHRLADRLVIDPCIPAGWQRFAIRYRFGGARYNIRVENPNGAQTGVVQVVVDGQEQEERAIPLVDDGRIHEVVVRMEAGAGRPLVGRVEERMGKK